MYKTKAHGIGLLFCIALVILCLESQNAYGSWLGDRVDDVKSGGRTLERGYQNATRPVRNTSNNIYHQTIRRPFNDFKQTVHNSVPENVRNIYKENVERRFRPLTDFAWDATTGRQGFSTAADRMADEYIEQGKELLITPDLYILYQSAKAASDPLPDDLVDLIAQHWAGLTRRTLHEEARFLVSAELVDYLTVGNAVAITFYDVIVFREPLNNSPYKVATLAHELVHVDQYHDLSFAGFAERYYIGGKFRTGRRNPLEREAYELGDRMEALLRRPSSIHRYTNSRDYIMPSQSRTAVQKLASLEAIDVDTNQALSATFIDAIMRRDGNDIKELAAFTVASPDVSNSARAMICRIIACGGTGQVFSTQEALDYGKLAVQYEPEQTINWYYLAWSANNARDIKTEYDALVMLASLMIEQEIDAGTQGQMTPRLQGAHNHLLNAANLGNHMGWQQGMIYDNRVPFMMLASIGLELIPSAMNYDTMSRYVNTAMAIDDAIRRLDRWHFELLDIYSQIHLRIGETVNIHPGVRAQHLHVCLNTCYRAINELNLVGGNVQGLSSNYHLQISRRADRAKMYLGIP